MDKVGDWWKICEAKAAPIWKHWFVGALIWTPTVFCLLYFWIVPPAPGMAAIVCAGFVALVILRELTHTHKLLCIGLVLALAATEIRSITKDRAEQSAKHLAAEKELQTEFNQTQNNITDVLHKTTSVFTSLTGTDSYPEITPRCTGDNINEMGEGKSTSIQLIIKNRGQTPLNIVNVTARFSEPEANRLYRTSVMKADHNGENPPPPPKDYNDSSASGKVETPFVLPPNTSALLPVTLVVRCKSGADTDFEIFTQTLYTYYSEIIHFKRTPPENDYSYYTTDDVSIGGHNGIVFKDSATIDGLRKKDFPPGTPVPLPKETH